MSEGSSGSYPERVPKVPPRKPRENRDRGAGSDFSTFGIEMEAGREPMSEKTTGSFHPGGQHDQHSPYDQDAPHVQDDSYVQDDSHDQSYASGPYQDDGFENPGDFFTQDSDVSAFPRRTHQVTAIVVSHNGAAWLPTTLGMVAKIGRAHV